MHGEPVTASMASQPSLKGWQTWGGRHAFLCDGRVMVGPDWGVTCFAVALTTVLSVAFWIFVCPTLAGAPLVTSVGMLLYALTLTLLVATATADPGILPRAPYVDDAESLANASAERFVEVRGVTMPLKWCSTCRIWRPPRASHCTECNVCVERFDHHCPWTGQCVGLRNYRYFFGFVLSVCSLCAYTLVVSALSFLHALAVALTDATSGGDRVGVALDERPVPAALSIATALILLCVCPLLCYHCSLTCRNATTSEEIKGTFADRANPFDQSCPANCRHVLCRPLPPSRLHLRSAAAEELGGPMILRNDGGGGEGGGGVELPMAAADEGPPPLRTATLPGSEGKRRPAREQSSPDDVPV